jgi:phosphomannomutase
MTNIDSSIFKAYDIRGVYPSQINADVVYKIAQGYAKFLNPKLVAVGYDMRLSGEEFKAALIRGLVDSGVNVIDLGLIPTDALYFAVPFIGADGGITATASHNPKEYGGLKLVKLGGKPVSGDSGIYEIRDLVIKGNGVESKEKGSVSAKNILDDYFKEILRHFDLKKIKPLKIVANTNFGMAAIAVERFKKILPVEFISVVNGHLDGSFPKGRPDPLRVENRDETMTEIKKLKPDLGVAWDGDGDRCFFFDEKGNSITPAYISALLAKYYLEKYPGCKILHDTRVIRVIENIVTESGGTNVANKAGYSFIKERMMKDDIVFGCETSGHYFFKDYGYHDNGLFPFLAILEILSSTGKTFSQVLAPLREKFYISEEINFTIQNQNILEEVKERYKDAKIENIDGYDFNYPDWRFNLRKSNTENLLRLNVEADSKNLLEQKIKEVTGLVGKLK